MAGSYLDGMRLWAAGLREWRCMWPGCVVRPLLGRYAATGGVEVRLSGRQGRPHAYVFDVNEGTVRAHCGACHRWSAVRRCDNGEIKAERWIGFIPRIQCAVCDARSGAADVAGPPDPPGSADGSTSGGSRRYSYTIEAAGSDGYGNV